VFSKEKIRAKQTFWCCSLEIVFLVWLCWLLCYERLLELLVDQFCELLVYKHLTNGFQNPFLDTLAKNSRCLSTHSILNIFTKDLLPDLKLFSTISKA
jgi:hypothetical protein